MCVFPGRVVIISINSIDERTVTAQVHWAHTSNLNLLSIFSKSGIFCFLLHLNLFAQLKKKERKKKDWLTLQREKHQ